jgi:hypothetical protein
MTAAIRHTDETLEQTCFRLLMENDRLRVVNDAASVVIDRLRTELADACAHRQAPSDDVLAARLAVALESLSALVRQLERIGGYATHEQQAELRTARAVLAEEGR